MNKLLRASVGLALFLFSSIALSANYYVISGSTGDVGSDTSCNGSANVGASAAPNCAYGTLAKAIATANSVAEADVITVEGIETVTSVTGKSNVEVGAGCGTMPLKSYANVTSQVTIQTGTDKTYLLDLNNLLPYGVVFGTGSDGSIIKKGSGTAAGFTITGKQDPGTDSGCYGRTSEIYIGPEGVSGVTVDGLTLNLPYIDGTSNTISGNVVIRFEGRGVTIRNCRLEGKFNTAILTMGTMHNNTDAGIAIYGNTFTATNTEGADSTATGIIIENVGTNHNTDAIAIYNNYFDMSAATTGRRSIYLRTGGVRIYVFNNRIKDTNYGIYLQDHEALSNGEWSKEDHKIFNNTITAQAGVPYAILGAESGGWGDCEGTTAPDTQALIVRNNLFSSFGSGAVRLTSGCGGYTANTYSRSTQDHFDYNLCYKSTGPNCVTYEAGNAITMTPNTATTTNPNLTVDLKLQASSTVAIAACSNDPIGAGAGVCSGSANSIAFDCTLDFQGEQRPAGSNWDCGADQYTDITALCNNNFLDPGEFCDHGNLNGATCDSLGYAGGTLDCDVGGKFGTPCQQYDIDLCGTSPWASATNAFRDAFSLIWN